MMVEFAHELTVWWQNGVSTILMDSYQDCWDLADHVWQEREFFKPAADAGKMLGVSCEQTQTITQAPMPELRP